MKKYILILILIVFILGCSSKPNIPKNVDLDSWQDSVSYSLGSDVGSTLKSRKFVVQDTDELAKGFLQTYSKDSSYVLGASIGVSYNSQLIDINPSIFLRALIGTYENDTTILSIEDMKSVVRKYDSELKEKQMAEAKQKADLNRVNGERFIEEFIKNAEDAIELESGLVYRILTEGFGDIPTDKDRVIVHYTGKLVDGTVFDSSVERGEPTTFMVGSVIKGWQEALQLMKVGSKWELVIPPGIAYGERATGNIPTNSTLLFEVELLGIE